MSKMDTVKKPSWIRYILQRIEKNKNFLAIISGPTGSGKSWSGLSIAEQLDPEFTADRVVFKGIDLLRLINSGVLHKGNVVLFDGAQIDINSRNWQSNMNKLINYLITTFRHKNFILIFTSPYADFIDTATLKLFHANFETSSINIKDKTSTVSPKLLQYNSSMKKWYRKYLKAANPSGGMVKVKRWCLAKPSDELIKAYEIKKKAFTSNLNTEIEDKLNSLDSNGKVIKALTPLQEEILKCLKEGITNQKEIGEKLSKDRTQICKNIMYIRNKGYDLSVYAKVSEYDATPQHIPQFKFQRPIKKLNSDDEIEFDTEDKDQEDTNNNYAPVIIS